MYDRDLIWCSSCGTEVSLARAVAELPCPACGSTNYFVVATDAERDALLSLSERMQRIGCWEVAEAAFRRCLDQGYITDADFNLSTCALRWRKECAGNAIDLVRSSGCALTVEALRELLLNEYDEYTVDWLLSDFTGLRCVSRAGASYVEAPYGSQEA